jgi:hypothetical protein
VNRIGSSGINVGCARWSEGPQRFLRDGKRRMRRGERWSEGPDRLLRDGKPRIGRREPQVGRPAALPAGLGRCVQAGGESPTSPSRPPPRRFRRWMSLKQPTSGGRWSASRRSDVGCHRSIERPVKVGSGRDSDVRDAAADDR